MNIHTNEYIHPNSIGKTSVSFQPYSETKEGKQVEELKQQVNYLEEELTKLQCDVHRLIHVLEVNGLIKRSEEDTVSFESTWGRSLYTINSPKGTDA